MIIAFIFSWNNLIFGLVLAGGGTRPVTMGILQSMTFDQIKWGLMARLGDGRRRCRAWSRPCCSSTRSRAA